MADIAKDPGVPSAPIDNPDPITKPEDTFDKLIRMNVVINSIRDINHKITDANFRATMLPYSTDSGEDLALQPVNLIITSIADRIAANPGGKLQLAMAALDEAIAEELAAL